MTHTAYRQSSVPAVADAPVGAIRSAAAVGLRGMIRRDWGRGERAAGDVLHKLGVERPSRSVEAGWDESMACLPARRASFLTRGFVTGGCAYVLDLDIRGRRPADVDLSALPGDTSLQRGMFDHIAAGGRWYKTGGFVLLQDLPWGRRPRRRS